MKVLAIVGLLLVAAAQVWAAGDGFVPIFNGRNLDGWVVTGKQEGFRVVDGCIHSDGGRGGDAIRTARKYGNFVVRMDWMLSKTGNSGIFVRDFEVQLLAPWTPYRDDLHCTGSLYGLVPVSARPDETTLRWRKAEISAIDKHITVKIDGVVTAEADYDQVPSMKGMALAGYVGMQDSHTGPGEWVKFRSIEIKDLDQDPAFVAVRVESGDPAIRAAARDAAVRLGAPVVPNLLAIISKDSPAPAHVAEAALSRIAANATSPGSAQAAAVCKALLSFISRPGPANGRGLACAVRAVGFVGQGNKETVSALSSLLGRGGAASASALEALQRLPGPVATEALVQAAKRTKPAERGPYLLALGARKDAGALPVLVAAAGSKDREEQLSAVRALGLAGHGKAVVVLGSVAGSGSEQVRKAAVDSLMTLADASGLSEAERSKALKLACEFAVTPAQKTTACPH